MSNLPSIIILSLGVASSLWADSMASSTGTFSNPPIGTVSGSEWAFASAGDTSSLSFVGIPSLVGANQTFTFGQLILMNGGQGGLGAGDHTIDLRIYIDLSDPSQRVSFVDTITLSIDNGSKGTKVARSSIPLTQTFASGGIAYAVTFNGMFDAPTGGSDITATGLKVSNPGPHEADEGGYAYLRATLTSGSAPPQTLVSNPEPQAGGLLLTVIAILAITVYRKTRREPMMKRMSLRSELGHPQ